MTYLDKLLIKGIRSYNPNDSNTIEFCSSMTLIVGANGTGKTTIIECLKYITTGNLPPNSKGGAFVYDARLAREVDIKAQVKLSFRDKRDKKMVCSRTLQCTQKATKIEQKTLESIIYEEGDKHSAIHIKAGGEDLGHFFGVSQCMLDSVIFCHQDESTWPISEPANIKKKFDDIFSSTKFSKALEALKASKRSTTSQIKLKYQELEFLYKNKQKKNEIEKRLEECSFNLSKKKKKAEEYEEEYKTGTNLLNEILKDLEKVGVVSARLKKLEDELGKLAILPEIEMTKEEACEILKEEDLENEINQQTEELKEKEFLLEGLEKKKKEFEKFKKEFEEMKVKKMQIENIRKEKIKDEEYLKEQFRTMCEKRNVKGIENFPELFVYFDGELDKRRIALEDLKKEIETLENKINDLENQKRENQKKIQNVIFIEDDPSVESFSDLINQLKIKRRNFKIEDLEKEYFDLQKNYQEEIKKSKDFYEIIQKKKRFEELKAKNLRNEKENFIKNLQRIKKIKEEIKEAQEEESRNKIYLECLKKEECPVCSTKIKDPDKLKKIIFKFNLEDLEMSLLDLEEENERISRNFDLLKEMKELEKEVANFSPVNTAVLEEKVEMAREALEAKRRERKALDLKIEDLEEKEEYYEKILANRENLKVRDRLIKVNEILQNDTRRLEEKNIIYKKKERAFLTAKENLFKKKVEIEHKIGEVKSKEEYLRKNELPNMNLDLVDFDEQTWSATREKVYEMKNSLNLIKERSLVLKGKKEEAKKHLEHFENKEKEENLKKEIQKIKKVENVEKELLIKKRALEEKMSAVVQKKSLLQGEVNQLTLSKKQIQRELENDYKDIIKEYNKAYLEHKVLELSLKDLDKFIQVLDKAILDFHSTKIDEVNKILKDLWVSCYKGNDVDYIEIKSESLSNKTYSYRISQIKNGVELEMRGRCSAGQKMLASILVRLSLAQTFGSNILALDEPTTNLDRDNIESLAYALLKISSNFQLIIITHDEEFVNILSRESSEWYYRITRNDQGDSLIRRHTLVK